jgi:hypothetical protein
MPLTLPPPPPLPPIRPTGHRPAAVGGCQPWPWRWPASRIPAEWATVCQLLSELATVGRPVQGLGEPSKTRWFSLFSKCKQGGGAGIYPSLLKMPCFLRGLP